LWSLFVVWATVSLVFVANHTLASDPARMAVGPQARPEEVARARIDLGLNRPLHVQYMRFWTRLLHVAPAPSTAALASQSDHATCGSAGFGGRLHIDLGKSFQQRRPVVTILAERVGRTLWLALAGAAMQIIIALGLGILAAAYQGSAVDVFVTSVSLLAASTPTFLSGLALQWTFAAKLKLLPLDGWGVTPADHARSLVLPALTLGIYGGAYFGRLVRYELVAQLGLNYMQTARSKGRSPWGALLRHALANTWVPLVTVFALNVASLIGGAIVTESLFRVPGIGSLSVTAMLDRDGPVMMGCVLIASLSVVTANALADALYPYLDPRLRDASRA